MTNLSSAGAEAKSTVSADPSRALSLTRHGEIAVIRIDRPAKRNAITLAMLAQLRALLTEAVAEGASGIVLTGSADLFSAGFDLSELGQGQADSLVDDEIALTALAIQGATVPVIAAIEGACIGAAVELVLSCDVRVASTQAFFSVPAVKLGILYRPDAIAKMVGLLGRETAMRLLVLAERISGPDLVGSGLVSRCVEPGTAFVTAIGLAEAGSDSIAGAVAATKALIIAASTPTIDLAEFEQIRLDLLGSTERTDAVAKAQGRPRA
ncbi:MAG: enoyl-CoA hydratase/isomerase family protein [Actinomycetes bacterium]